jgi:hypothetical protein
MAAPPRSPDEEAAAVTCGIVLLTPAAEFPLRMICRLPCLALAQVLDETNEFQQIRQAKERPLPTDDNLWVRCHAIRPLRRNSADGYLIDLQQKPLAIPGIPLADACQLPPVERMEWVRDAYKTRRCIGNTCILD